MADPTTALMCCWRRLERRCARCHAPWESTHLCADVIRHPSLSRLLEAVSDLQSKDLNLIDLSDRLCERNPWDMSELTDDEIECIAAAWIAAMSIGDLDRIERDVACAILLHAGVDFKIPDDIDVGSVVHYTTTHHDNHAI